MAQAIETAETVSTASGAEDVFPTVWTFEHADEVRVLVRTGAETAEQALGVDFELSDGDWLNNGADVVFKAGHRPPAGAVVARQRRSLQRQAEPFGDQERFRPQASEHAYDRLTRMAQDNHGLVARALAVPIGEAGLELAPAEAREGRLPVFRDGGIGHLDTPERLIATDAEGRAYALPLVEALNAIGQPFMDYGLLTPGETDIDDYGALV